MLSKRKYPGLNRAQRRHPWKLAGDVNRMNRGWALSPLLATLFVRAGITKVAA